MTKEALRQKDHNYDNNRPTEAIGNCCASTSTTTSIQRSIDSEHGVGSEESSQDAGHTYQAFGALADLLKKKAACIAYREPAPSRCKIEEYFGVEFR